MTSKVKLDGIEYEIESLSATAKKSVESVNFTNNKILELENTVALLRRAKKSYIEGLKQEMLSAKAGFLFADDE